MNKYLVLLFIVLILAMTPMASMAKFPGRGSQANWSKATLLYNSSIDATDAQRFADAANLCEQAIKIYPYDARFHCNLAVIYRQLHKLHLAEASAREAVKIAPNEALYQLDLSIILAEQGRLLEAKALIDKVSLSNTSSGAKQSINSFKRELAQDIAKSHK